MHPRLSVSAVCTWSWGLDDDLRLWADLGITRAGLSFRKLEAAGLDAAVRRVEAEGIEVTNVLDAGHITLDDRSRWPQQQERLEAAVDVAARLGAGCLVLVTGPAGKLDWEEAAAALAAGLAPVSDRAAAAGVPLAIEHTNCLRLDISFLTTLRDAIDLARQTGTGICIELNACWAERAVERTLREAAAAALLVQVSDAKAGSLSSPDRRVPGDGDIPLDRLLAALLAGGYEGRFDLELVGPAIEAEAYAPALRRSLAYLTDLLERLGA